MSRYIFHSLLLVYSFVQSYLLFPDTSVFLSKVLFIISLSMLYLFLHQINRILFRVCVVIFFFITFFVYPTLQTYGEPSFSYISSILHTEISEVTSYLKIIPIKVIITLIFFTIFTVTILVIKSEKIHSKIITPVLFVLLIALPAKKVLQYGINFGIIEDYFNVLPLKRSAFILNQFYKLQKEQNFIEEESKKPSSWKIDNIEEVSTKDNFVIVVGESVRRDFLNAYGFPIDNTPFINSSYNIIFEDYISIAPKTVMSLSRTLALANSENIKSYELNNNIITLASKIGYETHWISNQGITGHHNSPTTIIANRSDYTTFLRKGDGKSGYNPMDEEMLPFIKNTISRKSSKPKLIVIHMQGSHPYACDRTNEKYDEFILSKEISCYNKSIRNTDVFLEEIYKSLLNTNKSFNLIYFSDHGQFTNGKNIMHSQKPVKQAYQVPLIIWGDQIKKKERLLQRRVGTDFLYLFSEMNQISTRNIAKKQSFISNEENVKYPSKVFNVSEEIIDYEKIPSNPINHLIK